MHNFEEAPSIDTLYEKYGAGLEQENLQHLRAEAADTPDGSFNAILLVHPQPTVHNLDRTPALHTKNMVIVRAMASLRAYTQLSFEEQAKFDIHTTQDADGRPIMPLFEMKGIFSSYDKSKSSSNASAVAPTDNRFPWIKTELNTELNTQVAKLRKPRIHRYDANATTNEKSDVADSETFAACFERKKYRKVIALGFGQENIYGVGTIVDDLLRSRQRVAVWDFGVTCVSNQPLDNNGYRDANDGTDRESSIDYYLQNGVEYVLPSSRALECVPEKPVNRDAFNLKQEASEYFYQQVTMNEKQRTLSDLCSAFSETLATVFKDAANAELKTQKITEEMFMYRDSFIGDPTKTLQQRKNEFLVNISALQTSIRQDSTMLKAAQATLLAYLSLIISVVSFGYANKYFGRDRYSIFETTARTNRESLALNQEMLKFSEKVRDRINGPAIEL